jgi:hypothetical protein
MVIHWANAESLFYFVSLEVLLNHKVDISVLLSVFLLFILTDFIIIIIYIYYYFIY